MSRSSTATADHWRDYLDPPKYVKSFMLRGKDAVVTIDRVERAEVSMGAKKNIKALVFLKGKEQAIVAGVNILTTIAAIHGNSPAKWGGKRIIIYGTTTHCSDGTVECIRVRPIAPPEHVGTPVPALNATVIDEIPTPEDDDAPAND